jgi:hypothetical protein
MTQSPLTTQLVAPRFLLLLTRARIGDFTDEIYDLIKVHNYQAHIRVYGITNKGRQGFVMLQWESEIPPAFVEKWMHDADIVEVLPF